MNRLRFHSSERSERAACARGARHCFTHHFPLAALLLALWEDVCAVVDAFCRRSPHLDEQAWGGGERGIEAGGSFELPTRLPPPKRPLLPPVR